MSSSILAGVVFLSLAVLTTSAFTLIMRFSQERGYSVLAVGGVNYLVAAGAAAIFTSLPQVSAVAPALRIIAAVSGVGFVLTYLLLVPTMRRHGVTIPTAAVQVSMVVPVLLAALLWHETFGVAQAAGVAISLLAIVLLAPPPGERPVVLSGSAYLLVPGIFALSGGTRVAQKALTVLAPQGQQPALAVIWFGAAAIFSIGLLTLTGWPRRAGEWAAGLGLGLVNLGSLVFVLRTLDLIAATIVFPVISCLTLIVTSGGAFALWRERPTRRATLGIVVGLIAVVLVGTR
jgi:drug/metabolite transporter (DMT)-like permease